MTNLQDRLKGRPDRVKELAIDAVCAVIIVAGAHFWFRMVPLWMSECIVLAVCGWALYENPS